MMVDHQDIIPEIAQLVFKQGARLYELTPKQKSLEEIYVDIIEGSSNEDTDHH